MEKLRRIVKRLCILTAVMAMVLSFSVVSVSAESYNFGEVKHIGKYYLKYNYANNHLYVSKHKSRGFRKTPVNNFRYASNGKAILFVDESKGKNYIKSYDIAKKTIKKVKRLSDHDYWYVEAVDGNCIWLTNEKGLYRFRMKDKRLTFVKKNIYSLTKLRDNYYLSISNDDKLFKEIELVDGSSVYISPKKAAIYRITKDGKLKLLKSLGTTYGCERDNYHYKAKYVYYAKNSAHDLYRIKYNGKGKTRVASFDGYISYVANNVCWLVEGGIEYKFWYKTKKTEIYERKY